jgi:hypothetical protein
MDTGLFLKAMVNTALERVIWAKELPTHVQVSTEIYVYSNIDTHARFTGSSRP